MLRKVRRNESNAWGQMSISDTSPSYKKVASKALDQEPMQFFRSNIYIWAEEYSYRSKDKGQLHTVWLQEPIFDTKSFSGPNKYN